MSEKKSRIKNKQPSKGTRTHLRHAKQEVSKESVLAVAKKK